MTIEERIEKQGVNQNKYHKLLIILSIICLFIGCGEDSVTDTDKNEVSIIVTGYNYTPCSVLIVGNFVHHRLATPKYARCHFVRVLDHQIIFY